MLEKTLKPSKSPRSYPLEFREKAVNLITELGYTAEQVSVKLGCCRESFRRWKSVALPKLSSETILRMVSTPASAYIALYRL